MGLFLVICNLVSLFVVPFYGQHHSWLNYIYHLAFEVTYSVFSDLPSTNSDSILFNDHTISLYHMTLDVHPFTVLLDHF